MILKDNSSTHNRLVEGSSPSGPTIFPGVLTGHIGNTLALKGLLTGLILQFSKSKQPLSLTSVFLIC